MLNQGCQQNRQPFASVTGSYVQFYASIIMEAYNESICVSISMDFIGGCMGALRLTKTQGCVETKLSIFL